MTKLTADNVPKPAAMSISAVAAETGLSIEKLRTWERRYSFPQPQRDGHGDRRYPEDQVEKLRLIGQLMNRGLRPGKLVGKNLHVLRELGSGGPRPMHPSQQFAADTEKILDALRIRNAWEIRTRLRRRLGQLGVRQFVMVLVAGLNEVVGNAWARGEISAAEEHLYSEQVEAVLRGARVEDSADPAWPAIILTTLPGEQHKLGLLMVEALLSCDQVRCIPLGTGTPLTGIVETAITAAVDVVALSFSSAYSRRAAFKGLLELRSVLPGHIRIWAGGDGVRRIRRRIDGVVMPMNLESVETELAKLRAG